MGCPDCGRNPEAVSFRCDPSRSSARAPVSAALSPGYEARTLEVEEDIDHFQRLLKRAGRQVLP